MGGGQLDHLLQQIYHKEVGHLRVSLLFVLCDLCALSEWQRSTLLGERAREQNGFTQSRKAAKIEHQHFMVLLCALSELPKIGTTESRNTRKGNHA